ncbi:MAG: hypothetical protein CMJ77_24285 [Planctomycetaceae bacterium]|nr:hypothetical protein [Planctomycetaceae bacterium]
MQFSVSKTFALLLAGAVCLFVTVANGAVVRDTTANLVPPDDDPGWSNVGIVRRSTGIYLGDRWMMTAAHVGAGEVAFPDERVFAHDPESIIRLANPTVPGRRLSEETDIILFQLTEDPELPGLQISRKSPPIGSEVIFIGHGRNRDEEPTYWDVTRTWRWSESTPPGDYSGFSTVSGNSLRWGTNLIEDDEHFRNEFDDNITTVIDTNGDVIVLITEFDHDDGNSNELVKVDDDFITEFESQAVLNDSGGPLFYKNGNNWQLAGMAVGVDGFRNQPNVVTTAIFGNLTYFADLATYRDQIEGRVLYGDFDSDGDLTVADIDLLTLATFSDHYDPSYDLDRNGEIDAADRLIWVEDVKGTFFGDANFDVEFNSSDLIDVFQAAEYEDDLEVNSTWATGDWNGDLEFTTTDFVVALQSGSYEAGPRVYETPAASAVPEPSSVILLLFATLSLAMWRRSITSCSLSLTSTFCARSKKGWHLR